MKSLIFKQITHSGDIERTAIYLCGICIYSREEPYGRTRHAVRLDFAHFRSMRRIV